MPNRIAASPAIKRGVVGWESNDEHADIGSSSDDGHSFVRVTLFHGKSITDEPKEGKAQGFEILCKVMGPLYWVPLKGTPVLVCFPDDDFETPGSGVILGSIGKSPDIQFSKNKVKLDLGPDQDLVIKAKTVTVTDYNDNYMYIGKGSSSQPILKFNHSGGTGITVENNKLTFYTADGTAALDITPDIVSLVNKNGFISISSNVDIFSKAKINIMGAGVFLGSPATAGTASAVMTTGGASTAVVASH